MAKKTKLTAMSIRELKTWLDGYCSALGDEWSPTPEQWKMIKDKIFSLEDSDESYVKAPKGRKPQPGQPFSIGQSYGPVVESDPYGANNPDFANPPPMPRETLPQRPVTVGLTAAPPLITKDGVMKMPDGGEVSGNSGFA